MNDVIARRDSPEVLPDGRQPRRCDAHDVARDTLGMLNRFARRVALYILPSGEVLRIANPRLRDDDVTDSFIGVYDRRATEPEIVADILELTA